MTLLPFVLEMSEQHSLSVLVDERSSSMTMMVMLQRGAVKRRTRATATAPPHMMPIGTLKMNMMTPSSAAAISMPPIDD